MRKTRARMTVAGLALAGVLAVCGIGAAVYAANLDTLPATFLGANYMSTNFGAGGVGKLGANIDYVCIPRTNLDAALTEPMTTNDIRAMFYFMVKKTHAVIDAVPSTNRYNKLTVYTGSRTSTTNAGVDQQTFQQTFQLSTTISGPAAE